MESSVEMLASEVKNVRKSIVAVITYNSSGEMRSGSGFFMDNEGRIITNASIINDAYSAEVFSENNHYKKVLLLSINESLDIALLKVNAVNEMPIGIDYEYRTRLGDRVIVVGNPSGLKTTVSQCLISAVSSIGKGSDYIEIETVTGLLTYQYSKDGPVINMDGNVIGITTKNMPEFSKGLFPQEMYADILPAVSISTIKGLTEGPYMNERFYPPGTRVWAHWLLRELKEHSISTFAALYNMRRKKVVIIAFICIVTVALVQGAGWLKRRILRK
jgi:hypothetical protein